MAAALSLALPFSPAHAIDDLPFVHPAGGGRSISARSGVELTVGEPFFGAAGAGAMSSSHSRVFGGFWSRVDPVGPAAITDLTATAGPATGQLLLEWTAPGDDAFAGQAAAYELRLATSDFRDAFESGSIVPAPSPLPGGRRQALIVTGLLPGVTYFLAIKTSDELNVSMAAFASARALALGETAPPPPPFAGTTTPALENPPAAAAPIPTSLAQASLAAFAAATLDALEALPDPTRTPNGMITLVRPLALDPANARFDNTASSAGVVFVAAPGQALEQTHANDFARLPVDFVAAAQSFTSPGAGFTIGALGIFVGEIPSASTIPFVVSFVEDSAGLPSGRTISSKSFARFVSTEGALLQFDGFDVSFPPSGKLWAVISRPSAGFTIAIPGAGQPPIPILGATFDAYRSGAALGMGPAGWVPLKSPLGQTIQDLSFLLNPRPRGRYGQTVSRGRFNQGLRVLHIRHLTPAGARLSATLESGQDGTLFPAREDFALPAGAEVQDSSFTVTLASAPVYRLTLDFDAALSEQGLVTPAVAAAFGFFRASGTAESTIVVPYHAVRFGSFEADASTNGQGLAFYIRSARTREELSARPYASIAPGDTIMEPGDGPRLVEWAAKLAAADRFATPVIRGVTVNFEILPARKPAQVSVSAPAVLEAGAAGFAAALVLDDQGLPMANQRVSFAIAAGSATIPEAFALTDAQGIARVAFRPLDKTQLLSLEARAGDVAGRRGVYSVGGGLGGLGGLPTSDNGRAPHSLNLGNFRNFVARGAPHWGAHALPKDIVSFAWARRAVASVGHKLYAPDFFKKLFKAIGGAFNAAANAVKQVAQKTAALARKLVNKAVDLHKQALNAVKKVAESKLFQQLAMPVINAGLMSIGVPLQFEYGPNGWSTTIGFMGTGLTVGERGQLGVSTGLKTKVPGTPFEVGMSVGYDFKTGFNAGAGAGLAGSTPGKGLGVGIGYSEKVGTRVSAAASYDGLQAGVGGHGYSAGLNMNGVPGARKISGQLKEMGVRSSNSIQFGGDWNGKTKLDFKNDIGADWSKVQDTLAKTRLGAWGVEKFGSMLQPGHWGGWTLPKVPLRDVAKTLAGYKAPAVPRPELPAPHLWPDMPTMTGGGVQNLLADVAASPTCGVAPSPGGGIPGFPTSSPKQGVTSVTEQTPGFYQGLYGAEGMSVNPVNTRTGNLAYGVEDVYLAGSPLYLQLVRFHNSLQAESDGPFGFGWSFSYGLSVAESGGFAVVRLGDGSSRRYIGSADGSYSPPPGTFSRLARLASGWRLTHKFGSAYEFDASGRLLSITDPNGNQVTLAYASGRLTSVTAPGGRTLTFAYNAAGRVSSVTGPMGQLSYGYDAAGNLVNATGPDYSASYAYDAAHNLTAYTDPRAQTGYPQGSFTYDEFHRVKTESDGLGRVIAAFGYSIAPDGAQSTAVTDALGRVTRDAYDARGRWTTRADPAGTTTVLSWDPNLQLAAITEPDGRTTSFTHDARGNELTQTAPGGLTTRRTFDPATNAMLTETSPSGAATTRYGYDAKGNLVSITDPDGDATRFAFDAKGRLTAATDARGQVTSFVYDAAGLETAVTDARGARSFAYDAQGRLASTTDELGRPMSFTWDGAGGLTKMTYPGGATYTMAYDAKGNLVREVNERGVPVTTDYDANGNPTLFHHPAGGTTKLDWDAAGQLVKLTDPNGHAMDIDYDALGRPIRQRGADGLLAELAYDPAGRLTAMKDAKGTAVAYEHDAAGRVAAIATPAGRIGFAYDQDGRVNSQTSPRGFATAYTYSGSGLLKTATDPRGEVHAFDHNELGDVTAWTDPAGRKTTLAYDARGFLNKVRDPDGRGFDLVHDALGRVTEERDPLGRTSRTVYNEAGFLESHTLPDGSVFRYTHDALGNVLTETHPGAAVIAYTYTAADEPATVTDPEGNVTRLAYDPAGNVKTLTQPDGAVFQLAYDAQDRVKVMTGPNGATSYEYDATGMTTRVTDALGKVWLAEYDVLDRPKTLIDPDGKTRKYAYDAEGNLTREEDPDGRVYAYAFDELGRLAKYTDAAQKDWTFAYDQSGRLSRAADPLGRAVAFGYEGLDVAVTDLGGNTSRYARDAAGQLTAHTDANGQTTQYAYNLDGTLKTLTAPDGGVTAYAYDAAGNLTLVTDPILRVMRYAYDRRGLLTLETNPDATTAASTYDAMGRLLTRTDELGKVTSYAYDARGQLVAVTDPLGQVTRYEYDDRGNRTKVTDPQGSVTTFEYDAHGRLVSSKDPGGATTSFEYDGAGNQTAVVDPAGARTTLVYDAAGRLASQADPAGAATRFEYDAVGNQTTVTDPGGKVTGYVYDALSRLIQVVDPAGAITRFVYDAIGNLLSTTDPAGATTSSAYDAMGRVTQTTDALGNITRFAYDLAGNLTGTTDPLGRQSSTQYDTSGRTIATTDALNRVTRFEYDAAGNRTAVTDPAGNVTRFEYDAQGRLTAQVDPLLNRTTFKYDARGNKTEESDPEGHTTRFEYDADNRLAAIIDATGARRTFTYDVNGRKVAETDPVGATTRFEYDGSGRLAATIDPLGHRTLNAYDLRGNLVQMTDAKGNVSAYGYEDAGRLVRVTDAEGGVWNYSYDALGRLMRILDANGHATTFAYDAAGRMTSLADALGNTTSFEHDAAGNRTKLLKPNGEHLAYVYDLGGRLSIIRDQTGSQLATLTWDALDRLSLMDSPDVKTAYTYDAGGRMTRLDYLSMGHALDYTYDKDGLRKTMALAGELTNYGYDAGHRLIAMTAPEGGYSFAYDAVGRQTLRNFPNGVRSSYAYDAKGQLLNLQHRKRDGALLNSFTYQYDQNGNRTSMTDNLGRHEYGYDRLDRLTRASAPFGLTQTYGYDPVGNRTKLKKERRYPTTPVPPGKPAMTLEEIDYFYDAADRLLKAGTTDYVFDAVGRTREVRYPGGNVTTFQYDPYDRPSRISGLRHHQTGEPLTDSLYAYAPQLPDLRFTPAPLGVRIKKTDSKGVTKYVVDNTGNGAAELDQANNIKTRYRHTAAIDDPLGLTDAQGRAQGMQLDGLGSVSMLTDALGSTVQGYTYDPFGTPSATAHEANSLKYTGRTWDPDARLQENRARHLDLALGRWITIDPLSIGPSPSYGTMDIFRPIDLHRCGYSGNSPIGSRDPLGLFVTGVFDPNTGSVTVTDDITRKSESADAFTGGFAISAENVSINTDLSAPPGEYAITNDPNPQSTHLEGWFGLIQRNGSRYVDDEYRFHLGARSRGCLTVNKFQADALLKWRRIKKLIGDTKEQDRISYLQKRSGETFRIRRYGTMRIKTMTVTP